MQYTLAFVPTSIFFAKTEGKALGERVTCVTSGRCEGGQCPTKNLSFSRLEADQRKVCELQHLGTAPLTSPLMSTWCHTRDSFSQAFPLHFWILQTIKGGNGLGTRTYGILNYVAILYSNSHSHTTHTQLRTPNHKCYSSQRQFLIGYWKLPSATWQRTELSLIWLVRQLFVQQWQSSTRLFAALMLNVQLPLLMSFRYSIPQYIAVICSMPQ